MSQVITAVYEHGALHPLTPLALHEHQQVQVHILPEAPQETAEDIMAWFTRLGRLSRPQTTDETAPCSDEERLTLAQALGEATSMSLSVTILEERGAW